MTTSPLDALTVSLNAAFAPLDTLGPRLVAYVRDGTDDGAVAALASTSEAGRKLRLKQVTFGGGLSASIARAAPVPEVLARLGRVYATAAKCTLVEELAGDLAWVESLLWQGSSADVSYETRGRITTDLSASALAAAMSQAGADPVLLVRIMGSPADPARGAPRANFRKALFALQDVAALILTNAAIVRAGLDAGNAATRAQILEGLAAANVPVEPFLESVIAVALESKSVRDAALPLLERLREVACDRLRALLAGTLRKQSRALAEETLAALAPAAAEETLRTLPPVPPFPDDARRELEELMDTWLRDAPAKIAAYRARARYMGAEPSGISPQEWDAIFASLSAPDAWDSPPAPRLALLLEPLIGSDRAATAFLLRPDLHPVYVVRLLRVMGANDAALLEQAVRIFADRAEATGLVGLAEALDLAAFDGRRLGLHALGMGSFREADLLALLAARPAIFDVAMGLRVVSGLEVRSFYESETRARMLAVLVGAPEIPASLAAPVLRLALRGRATERARAQAAARKIAGWEDRAKEALADPSSETRSIAARWLGRARVAAAREPLLARLRIEKNEPARAALMDALMLFGEPLEMFLDRAALRAEAEKVNRKLAPPAWLDLARLPSLHWADSREPLDPAVLRAWLASAHKAKSVAPPPLLRMYARGFREDDAAAFAIALLSAWIKADTAPAALTPEKEEQLRGDAQSYGVLTGRTEAEAYERLTALYLATPTGSAIADKGLLALVSAFGGRGIADVVGLYLKTWYGWRAAQCRALLEVLAWLPDRAATQLLLATATRFRTAGIRAEAEAQVKELAERRGWSVDELADRTIPTAGLDDEGVLTIVYGGPPDAGAASDAGEAPAFVPTRTFVARIDERGALALADSGELP